MLRLILMRHAKSDWSHADLSDHERPLNQRGFRDAPAMAKWIESEGLRPDLILCSSAERTCQTASLMNEAWSEAVEVTTSDSLYLASANAIFYTVASQSIASGVAERPQTVMVLAHNPGISHAASVLASEMIQLPTAALVVIEIRAEAWSDFQLTDSLNSESATTGSIQLITQMTPKSLPQ